MGLIKSKASACDEKSRDKTDGWGQGKTAASELARSHDLTVAEVEQWLEDFVSMGTEALRLLPGTRRPDTKRKSTRAKNEIADPRGLYMGGRDQAVAKGWMEEISCAFSSLAFRSSHSSCKASQYSGRFPK